MIVCRVLVVDHSALFRDLLTEVLHLAADIHVVGAARTVIQAHKLLRTLRPDVVTLDMDMPHVDMAELVRSLSTEYEVPVVVVSGRADQHGINGILAVEAGARALVQKPKLDFRRGTSDLTQRFIAAVRGAASGEVVAREDSPAVGSPGTGIRAVSRQPLQTGRQREPASLSAGTASAQRRKKLTGSVGAGVTRSTLPPGKSLASHLSSFPPLHGGAGSVSEWASRSDRTDRAAVPLGALRFRRIVAIGASTGGTEALLETLRRLPVDSCPVLVVQHMPAQFTTALAARLDRLCKVQVREAQDQDLVQAGTVLIAPGDRHMRLARSGGNFVVHISDDPPVGAHRPSVDVLFESCAQHAGDCAIGVLLTGMGSDGAYGLGEMRNAGGVTIAQDEASCVVFGMPKEAILRGAVMHVVPLRKIAAAIAKAME